MAEKVEDLISQKALQQFDELGAKVDKNVKGFEELLTKAVQLNSALGNSKNLKEVTDLTNQLNLKEKELLQAHQDLIDAQNQLAARNSANVKAIQSNAAAIQQQTSAIDENVNAMQRLQAESKKIKADMDRIAKAFKDGKISADQYENEMAQLGRQDKITKDAISNLNKTISLQVKEQNAAVGSMEQMKAKLALLTRAYDNLATSQRNSGIGKEIKNQINGVNDQLKQLEAGTGRFQRNVGNYQSALSGIGAALGPIAAATIGLSSISQFFNATISEAEEAAKNAQRFRNTLQGIGKEGDFERLNDEASRLAKTFGYLDNDDVVDTFNQLFTYGKLTETQIKALTPVIIDFAAKAQLPLAEATEKVILGLEGNGRELKKFGINIKDGKDVAERFNIVMTDMKSKVEGAGESFKNSLAGDLEVSKRALLDIEETVGTTVLPAWNNLKIAVLSGVVGLVQGFVQVKDNVVKIAQFISNTFKYGIVVSAQMNALDNEKKALTELSGKATEYGQSYAKSINGNVDALKKELAANKEILKADQARFDALRSRDDSDTEKKQAVRTLLNSRAIVAALQTEIRVRGEKATTADTKEKEAHVKRISFYADELKAQQDTYKKLSEGDSIYILTRLQARKQSAEFEKQILEGQRDAAIKNAGGDKEQILEAQRDFNFKSRQLQENLDEDLRTLRNQANNARRAEEKATNEAFLADFQKSVAGRLKAAEDAFKKERDISTGNQSVEVSALNARFLREYEAARGNKKKQAKLEEDYGQNRLKIDEYYAEKILQQEIKYAEAVIAIEKSIGNDTGAKEAELASIKQRYSDLVLAHKKANNAEEIKSDEEKYNKQLELIRKIQGYSDAVMDIIGGAVNASVIAEKNRLQDQSDQIEINAKKEIEAINASADAAETKAARIELVNTRAQTQKEEIERKNRALEQRKAEFEKARNIASIILNTAAAVVSNLKESVFAAIAAGAIGAAQLAIAINTPVPRFEYGTTDSGPVAQEALVGERRSELMVTPDGRLTYIPKGPKVMTVPAHSIIFPDAQQAMEAGIGQGHLKKLSGQDNLKELKELLGSKFDTLTKTVRDKQELHMKAKISGWEVMKQRGNVFTKYL